MQMIHMKRQVLFSQYLTVILLVYKMDFFFFPWVYVLLAVYSENPICYSVDILDTELSANKYAPSHAKMQISDIKMAAIMPKCQIQIKMSVKPALKE